MRTYPRNSPQAAARILAMAMLADGELCRDELNALADTGAREQIGLDALAWHDVVHAFCEDLIEAAAQRRSAVCELDEESMFALLDEVDDPALRERIMALCGALTDADAYVAEGESVMLAAMMRRWRVDMTPA